MTILNVWIEDERALLAVDTISHHSFGGMILSSKVVPLVHANTLIAYRGSNLAFLQLFAQIMLDRETSSYDQIVDSITMTAARASANWQPTAPAGSLAQIYVVGWSEATDRFEGRSYDIDLSEGWIDPHSAIDRCRLTPGSGIEAVPSLGSPEAMMAVARHQLEWMHKTTPAEATGGQLVLAELTRQGCSIRSLGNIK